MSQRENIEGVLFGAAVGDAIGLPAEGLSKSGIKRRGWNVSPWKHRFFLNRGMWSDDTEHTFMVGNALLQSNGEVAEFTKALGWKLRWWLLAFPAGVGMATARACIKLWLGFPPKSSGVFSAGNGPAMRSGIIGAVFDDNQQARKSLVRASTRITHTHPKAEIAAQCVAETVAFCCRSEKPLTKAEKLDWIEKQGRNGDNEWQELVGKICAASGKSTDEYAAAIGCEKAVTGYAYHTVPVALHAWLTSEGDFRKGIESVINCGGDTDTCASITGALCGAETGIDGIPVDWINDLKEWPRTKAHLQEMAKRLAADPPQKAVSVMWVLLPFRNLLFLIVVISHGLLRIFK